MYGYPPSRKSIILGIPVISMHAVVTYVVHGTDVTATMKQS